MKVNKCNCSGDDDRIIESKNDIAKILKGSGMPADVLAITSVGFLGDSSDFPIIYLVNRDGKEFTAAIQREPLRELCEAILEALDKADAEEAEQSVQ